MNLDRRINIETPTISADSAGGQVKTWSLLATVWAQVQPVRGGERFLAAQKTAEAEVKFSIRYMASVDENARIVFDGLAYDLLNVAELGRREWLEILAKRT